MGRKIEDLSGRKFGRLTVIEPIIVEKRLAGYRCRCDCGKEVVAKGYYLKCGNMKSCGCLRKEQREKWTEAGRASYKLPKTLCVSCIRSAAPPELQCIWDASKAQQLPEDAETIIIDTEGGNGTRHIYVVKCPEYLSLFDTNNAKLLQEARRRNDAWRMRELAERCGSSL